MALRERDLYVGRPVAKPTLAVVPPPPRRHPVAATVFVILLCAVLSVPIASAVMDGPPAPPFQRPRPIAAGAIPTLDKLGPVGRPPRSAEPLAGIAFVRCTGLWAAEPDGSNPRRLLAMSGISSPEFSPDARTIAFVRMDGSGQSLWLASADGHESRRLGTIASGGAGIDARVTGLAWSPNGDEIAFALTDGTYGPLAGGSAIWSLDVTSGTFRRVASGWPAPTWHRKKVVVAGYESSDLQITQVGGHERVVDPLNSLHDDVAAAVVPPGWWNASRNGAAILRGTRDGFELAIRTGWNQRDRLVVEPPPGYRFARFAQPTINQDGSRVAIDLIDPGAGRDLGLLDTETGKWDLLDYAWEPSASPTPTILGRISRNEARVAADMLMNAWARRWTRAEMLTHGPTPRSTFPWERFAWAVDDPYRSSGRWVVPLVAYTYTRSDDRYEYRSAEVTVRRIDGRLTATPTEVGPVVPVVTLQDAHAFAEAVVGRPLPNLPSLPAGTYLANRYALNASSWDGLTQATFLAVAPATKTSRKRDMTFAFGEGLSFTMGCGGAVDPDPVAVGQYQGLADRSGRMRQIIWPATEEDPTGPLSIYGNVPKEDLIEMAEDMAIP